MEEIEIRLFLLRSRSRIHNNANFDWQAVAPTLGALVHYVRLSILSSVVGLCFSFLPLQIKAEYPLTALATVLQPFAHRFCTLNRHFTPDSWLLVRMDLSVAKLLLVAAMAAYSHPFV